MTELVIAAAEVGIQLYSIAQQLPQDIKTWKLNRELLPVKLESFRESLSLVDTHLRLFRDSLQKGKGVSANQFQRSNTLFKVEKSVGVLNEISMVISKLEKRVKSSTILKPIVAKIDSVTPTYEQLLDNIDDLSKDVEAVSALHVTTKVRAPAVPPDYYFDAISNSRGNAFTKVLCNILNDENHPIGAVIVGAGGMGKTIAACRAAWDVKTKMQFKDGILFVALGDKSSEKDVISKVASLVQYIGRGDAYQDIRDSTSIDEAVTRASFVFEDKKCLIIFDDVWSERIKSVDLVVALSNLVTCNGTKVAFTTRDRKYLVHPLTSKVAVFLEKRCRSESERMLLASTGLEKPVFEEGLNVFNRILDDADGMPLALSLAGNSIKQISLYREDNDRQYAWSDYGRGKAQASNQEEVNGIILQHISGSIMRSISFIQKQTGSSKYIDYFCALSVFQRAERMPYNVLCRAFGESKSVAIDIVDTFMKYGIVGVKRGEEADSNLYVTIHGLVLDCAISFVGKDEEMKKLLLKWLFSFWDRGRDIGNAKIVRSPEENFEDMKNAFMKWMFPFHYGGRDNRSATEVHHIAGSFKRWWPETEDDEDNYLYRNVIRILKRACMFEEIVWLINEPWWIAKQLKVNGFQQIRSDLDISLQCVRNITQMEQCEHEMMEKWIRLLNATITACYDYVSKCEWDGMVYTQLYGRLQYYSEADDNVNTFLEKIKESAPRPFFLPSLGSFPTTSPQLLEKFECINEIVACKQISDCIYTVSSIFETSVLESRRNKDENIEEEGRTTLRLQVNDLSNGLITREDIAQINEKVSKHGVLSDSGHAISVATSKGDIILLEKLIKVGRKEDEPSPQDVTNEDRKTPKHPSRMQSMNNLFQKRTRRMVSSRLFDYTVNQIPVPTQDNPKLIRILCEAKWRSTVLRGRENSATSVAISADESRIVSSSFENTVRVWEAGDNEWKSTALCGHEGSVWSVAISADGTRIVSGSFDNTVRVWELKHDEWQSAALYGHEYHVTMVAISGDGMRIVSGSADKTVRIWEQKNYEWQSTVLRGHNDGVWAVAISADGTCVVSGSFDNTVRLWEAKNDEWQSTALHGQGYSVRLVAISGDGMRITSVTQDSMVCVWEVQYDKWKSAALCGHKHQVTMVAISGDGTRIVSGSADKTVRVWGEKNDEWQSTVLRGHKNLVRSVAILADGTRIVSGSFDNTVRVWEVKNNEWHPVVLNGHDNSVMSVVISVDGTRIVSGSDDNTLRAWKIENNDWKSDVMRGHNDSVRSVVMSADGTRIVSQSADNKLRVWEVKNDKWHSMKLHGHENWMRSVAISANGRRIVSGSFDNTVRVWKVENSEWKFTAMRGHKDSVISVAISADGMRIVSGSHDLTVRVWELRIDDWNLSKTISVDASVDYVALSYNSNLIEISLLRSATKWWELSGGSWRECQDPIKVFYQGHLNLGSRHSLEESSCHAKLTPAHMQALGVLESDPDVKRLCCVSNGFYVWRREWPYFGFITIVE